jgi:hypothetical protein
MSVVDHGLSSLFVGMRSVKYGVVVLELAICVALACARFARAIHCWERRVALNKRPTVKVQC